MSDIGLTGAAPAASSRPQGARLLRFGAAGWLSLGMILLLGMLVVPPILVLIENSFTLPKPDGSPGVFTLDHYKGLFTGKKLYVSAWNSVVFASLSTVFALLLGGLTAWVVERTNAPFRSLAYFTTVASLAMPFILYVLGWMYLLGRVGPFNDLYRTITGNTDVLFNIHSMSGMVMVEAFAWLPWVFLMFAATFRASNAEMEEAARMSGASVAAMIRRVSLPLARPAILATALFVFIRTLEAFDIPAQIGRPAGINLLTSDIYYSIRKVPADIGHASAFSVVLTLVIAVLMYYYGKISRNADRYATVTGKSFRPRPTDLGKFRWLGGALVIFNFLVGMALPMIAVLWVSFQPFVRAMRWNAFPTMTLSNYEAVLREKAYLALTSNTLIIAAGAATMVMAIMLAAGWLVARRKPGAVIIDQLTTMPLLLPGIVLGVAMMELALRTPLPLYGTIGILILAFFVRYMPFGMRYSFTGVLQIHRELEEAAAVSGAGMATTMRRVLLPLLLPALAAGWLFVFLNAAKELSLAILLAGPKSQTMAVAIFEQSVNGQFSELAALGVIWTLLMTGFAIAFHILTRQQNADLYGK